MVSFWGCIQKVRILRGLSVFLLRCPVHMQLGPMSKLEDFSLSGCIFSLIAGRLDRYRFKTSTRAIIIKLQDDDWDTEFVLPLTGSIHIFGNFLQDFVFPSSNICLFSFSLFDKLFGSYCTAYAFYVITLLIIQASWENSRAISKGFDTQTKIWNDYINGSVV